MRPPNSMWLPIGLWLALAGAGPANPPERLALQVRGATVEAGGSRVVRIYWLPSQGWVPIAGIDVYRRSPGGPWVLRTDDPVDAAFDPVDPRLGQVRKPGMAGRMGAWLSAARSASPRGRTIESFRPPAQVPSRRDEFQSRAAAARALSQRGKGEAASGPQAPRLPRPPLSGALPGPRRQRSEEDEIRSGRVRLVMAAAADPGFAVAAGLAWDDRDVRSGARYEYSIRRSTPVTDPTAELARLTITVGRDPPVPAPTGLLAEQTGPGRVELRWDRPSTAQAERDWIVGWNLARSGTGGTTRLNTKPLVVLDRLQDGSRVEPVSFFLDREAPVGKVGYTLTAVDLFGRESRGAAVSLVVEDWRVPEPVGAAEAALDGGAVRVMWTAHPLGREVAYRILRLDTERAKEPVLLTHSPIRGEPLPTAAALPGRLSRVREAARRPVTAVPWSLDLGEGDGSDALRPPSVRAEPTWLTWVDPSPPKDAYLRYLVVAELGASGKSSAPQPTGLVPVPATAPPAAPTGLTTASVVGVSPQADRVMPRFGAHRDMEARPGATVTLVWDPVPGAVEYRIWRIPTSFYLPNLKDLRMATRGMVEAMTEAREEAQHAIGAAAGTEAPPLVTGGTTPGGLVQELTGIPRAAFSADVGGGVPGPGGEFPMDGRFRQGQLGGRLRIELQRQVLPAGQAAQGVVGQGTRGLRDATGAAGTAVPMTSEGELR